MSPPGMSDVDESLERLGLSHEAISSQETCERCARIDLSILDRPQDITTIYGISVAALGQPTTWAPESCHFCRFLRFVQRVDHEEIKESTSWDYTLIAFSTKINYGNTNFRHELRKDKDKVLLGIRPTEFCPKDVVKGTGQNHITRNKYGSVPGGWIVRIGGQEKLLTTVIENNKNKFGLDRGFIAESNPSNDEFIHIKVPLPRVDFGLLKQRLQVCCHSHKHDGQMPDKNSMEPVPGFRVIDCRQRRIVTASHQDEYVALSYVWGGYIDDATQGLPTTLPATIEDAMTVVLELGLNYLWVDRYCIHQHDANDKMAQIPRMGTIYLNALCTIVMAAGSSPTYGLPGAGSKLRKQEDKFSMGGRELVVVPWAPSRDVEASKWYTRAWTYQEAVLSQRRLFFTDHEVYFECPSTRHREYLEESPYPVKESLVEDKKLHSLLGDHSRNVNDHIYAYTTKSVSYDSDILNAISGIFQVYLDVFSGSGKDHGLGGVIFIQFWGLPIYKRPSSSIWWEHINKDNLQYRLTERRWTVSLLEALLWSIKQPAVRRQRFPSWSWCGWKGGVVDQNAALYSDHRYGDPDAIIRIKVEDDDLPGIQDIQDIAQREPRPRKFGPTIYMEAWVVRLSFEFLSHGPDPNFVHSNHAKQREPGFYTTVLYDGSATGESIYLSCCKEGSLNASRLQLTAEVTPESPMFEKLQLETWDCIVVAHDHKTFPEAGCRYVLLVCDWEGDMAQRIGIVNMAQISRRFDANEVGKMPVKVSDPTVREWRKFQLV